MQISCSISFILFPSSYPLICYPKQHGSYPKVSIKLERSVLTDNQRNNTVVEKIYVEFDEEDPSVRDYLKNIGKKPEDFDTGKEYLLPSEVMSLVCIHYCIEHLHGKNIQ